MSSREVEVTLVYGIAEVSEFGVVGVPGDQWTAAVTDVNVPKQGMKLTTDV